MHHSFPLSIPENLVIASHRDPGKAGKRTLCCAETIIREGRMDVEGHLAVPATGRLRKEGKMVAERRTGLRSCRVLLQAEKTMLVFLKVQGQIYEYLSQQRLDRGRHKPRFPSVCLI